MVYFDSHCHINDEALLGDVANVIKESKEAGLKAIIAIGWDLPSSIKAIQLGNEYDFVYAAIGFHPENLEEISDDALKEIERLAKENQKVVAIGEIGLDYHWFKEEKDRANQKQWFIKQIELANKLGLPISIHARDAAGDTYDILEEHTPKYGGVLHCYSSSKEMMDRFAKLGLYFGFDGPITFKNAVEPKECVAHCLEDRILVETDSPYLSPTPFRGKTNSPKNIPLIVKQMAELRGVSEEKMTAILANNFEKLFRVKL